LASSAGGRALASRSGGCDVSADNVSGRHDTETRDPVTVSTTTTIIITLQHRPHLRPATTPVITEHHHRRDDATPDSRLGAVRVEISKRLECTSCIKRWWWWWGYFFILRGDRDRDRSSLPYRPSEEEEEEDVGHKTTFLWLDHPEIPDPRPRPVYNNHIDDPKKIKYRKRTCNTPHTHTHTYI